MDPLNSINMELQALAVEAQEERVNDYADYLYALEYENMMANLQRYDDETGPWMWEQE